MTRRLAWLPLLAVVALAIPKAAVAESQQHDRALRLYKQKKYDEACPLFEKAATEAKSDGALWADLGLCELRRGRKEAGQRASLLAVRHGDAAVRKSAYFNLHASGYRVRLPEPKPAEISCDFLPVSPPFECEEKLWACTIEWTAHGSGGGTAGTNVVFGSAAEDLEELRATPSYERVETTEDPNAVPLRYEEEEFCGYCYVHAWDCASSKVVAPAVERCFERVTGTSGKRAPSMCSRPAPAEAKLCGVYTKCYDELCERALKSTRETWPEAADEIGRAREICKDCGIQESKTCEVVAVDACRGHVGFVCQQMRREKKGKLVVHELTLTDQDGPP